ncbi:uncharacterized protein PFB0145c-like, partial [Bradysia coprophila]|uniref:uncharacterized protein PFB0145c-like n=1 Tax=Bradysia coprophila TaxID=38358 RepID=UPI00187D8DD0
MDYREKRVAHMTTVAPNKCYARYNTCDVLSSLFISLYKIMINNNNEKGNDGNNSNFICDFNKWKHYYENLIDSITKELDFYKTEHTVLRAEIGAITSHKIEPSSNECDNELTKYKNASEAVVKNLKSQLEQLSQEQRSLYTLWNTSQKIISHLELEINEKNKIIKDPTLIEELKQQLKISQENFAAKKSKMKTELEKEREIKLCLIKNYKNSEEKFKLLEQKYSVLLAEKPRYIKHITILEQQLHSLKSSNVELQSSKTDLEKRLSESLCTVRDSIKREQEALAKVQELLNITDLAIAEKNATLLREKDIRDDCDHLTSSIAEVFEEAANKVEKERTETEKRHMDSVKQFEEIIARMKVTQTQISHNYSIAQQKNQLLESKLKESEETNSKLDADLQVASLQIVDLEMKLQAAEKVNRNEKEANKILEKRTQEFQDFLDKKKRLNERYLHCDDAVCIFFSKSESTHAYLLSIKTLERRI